MCNWMRDEEIGFCYFVSVSKKWFPVHLAQLSLWTAVTSEPGSILTVIS